MEMKILAADFKKLQLLTFRKTNSWALIGWDILY